MGYTDIFRPEPSALFQRPNILGKVFFVDSSAGDTGNEGTDPNYPLTTLQAGIDKATDDNGDYVIVLDCYNSDSPPILFNSSTTHVIGMSLPCSWQWCVLVESSDLITLSGNYMEIAGFSFAVTGADAIHVSSAAGAYSWLHHCSFGCAAGTTVNAIEFDGTSAFTNSMVEDCFFGCTTSSLSGYGITGNGIFYTVRNCMFKNCNTKAINISSPDTGGGYILHNYFSKDINDTPPLGWAITLSSSSTDWLVAENYASTTGEGTGNNPYEDNSSGATTTQRNSWAMNYWADTVIDPLHSGE